MAKVVPQSEQLKVFKKLRARPENRVCVLSTSRIQINWISHVLIVVLLILPGRLLHMGLFFACNALHFTETWALTFHLSGLSCLFIMNF
jgi:hypothetical protein